MLDSEGKVKGMVLAEPTPSPGRPEGWSWGCRESLLWGAGKARSGETRTLGGQTVWFISCLCPFPAV